MEQRLAALFATVGNALDSSTYTYSDSDYLVRKALTEFLDGENALVASARKIQDPTEVVTSILNYIVSTDFSAEDPADWYRKAMRIVVEFSDFAFRNEMSKDSARYSALLPEGHPRALNSITLTASAQRSALAEWMAADPRLDEEASAQVRKLYSSPGVDGLDLEFEYLKAEAMVASGKMPEELLPLTAAFNLSRAQRSAISAYLENFRRRDRKGRFADEFGRLSLIFGDKNGGFFSKAPKIVGPGSGPDRVIVEFDGSDPRIPKGLYDVDATKGENVQAYLPTSAVKKLPRGREVVAEGDKQYAIGLDELLASRVELPLNWEKSGKGFKSKDGKFVAEPIKNSDAEKAIDRARERGDELIIAGVGDGDAFDPEASGGSFLIADAKGKTLGVAQDWAGIQEIAVANGADSGQDASPVSKPTTPEVAPDGAEGPSPDLDQDVDDDYDGDGYDPDTTPRIEKSKLSPSMLGEGYNFSKEGENSWVQDGVGSNGESYAVSKAPNGKWVVTERSGSGPDNQRERDLQSFDTAEEAFDFANGQGAEPNDFDEDWVSELMFGDAPDLDQNVTGPKNKLDAADFSPEDLENVQKYIDSANQAIFNNDRAKLNDTISKAATDSNVSDEAYSALFKAKDARDARDYEVENALAGGSREDVEALLEDPEYAGWASRLEDALAVDLDQEAPTLSEKQSEPASGKQYAFLSEFLAERQLDPATEQALKDAIANKNLNKAQASALIGIGRAADFKPGVDPTKPSERMLDSLQGYLATKDLAPSEIKEVLDSLQKDGSRDNVDALLNKLRRKKDKPVDLNQGVSGLTRHSDGSHSWEDDYNNINVNNTPRGWEVEYTSPSMEDGVNDWYYKSFASEDEALAFAEELLKQNQEDSGYSRAADNLFDRGGASSDADLDQDVKGTLADAATDKQWNFLQSLLDGKKINNPELEAAVRSALADRNLTKGEVGAFIGQLRPLEDKPNVRREPSAKQIASVKRALLERDMTPEERKSMQDKLAAGLSFDEASEMLNDLKKRDITPEGMDNLLSELKSEQDIETLRYLLDKPEYSKYRTDVKDALRQLALDTEDPYLQEFIDAREDVDLDQNVTGRRYGNEWDVQPEFFSPEDGERYSREISEINLAVNIGHYPTVKKLAEKYSNDSSLPEDVKGEFLNTLETWLEYNAEVIKALQAIWDEDESEDTYESAAATREIDFFIGNAVYRPWWPLLAYNNGTYNIVQSEEEYDELMDDLALDLKDAMDRDVDLDQDVADLDPKTKSIVKDALDSDTLGYISAIGDLYDGLDFDEWTSPDGRVKLSLSMDGESDSDGTRTWTMWGLEVDGEDVAGGTFDRDNLVDEMLTSLGLEDPDANLSPAELDARRLKDLEIARKLELETSVVKRARNKSSYERAGLDIDEANRQEAERINARYDRQAQRIKDQAASRDVDLNQDVDSWWDLDLDVMAKEDQEKYADQIAKINFAMTFGHAPTIEKFREEVLADKSISDQTRLEIVGVLEEWLERDGEVYDRLSDIWDADTVEQLEDAWSALAKLENDPEFAPWGWFTGDFFPRNKVEYPEVVDRVGKLYEAETSPDLDQNVSSNLNQAAEYFDSMSNPDNWTDWSSFPEYTSPDGRLKIRAEGDPEGNYLEALLDGEDLDLDDDARKAILDTIESSNFYAGMQGVTRKDKERTAKDVTDIIRESLADVQGGPDLDQDASNVSREVKQTVIDSLDDDFIVELDLGGKNYSRDGLDSYSWTSPDGRVKVSMESDGDTEAETSSTTWFLEVDGEEIAEGSFGLGFTKLSDEIFNALGISVSLTDEEEANYRLKFAKAERDAELAKINRRSEGADNILARMTPEKRADYENIMQQQRDLVESRYNRIVEGIKSQYGDIDLDQDVSSNSLRTAEIDRLADKIDAMDRGYIATGDELKDIIKEFDEARTPSIAIEMSNSVYDISNYVGDDVELRDALRALSARLDEEIADRFGVAQAALGDGDDILDLYDYSEKVRQEIEIYFETDADTIVERLDENGYYGDNRSGGAEARVSENEDGTYTARVDYDRDGEEQTFEDRDEALAWAANGVAKYNSNVIPNTYDKDIDLEEEAQNAKTDAEAAAFADRLDEIARDLDENRGDPRAARELRSYGERIREMIEKRDRQNQSEVESEPLNSETMDEMATDPDLNPAGYADYVSDDLYRQLEASEKADPTGITNTTDGLPTLDSYESADGRVKVEIDYDADFDGDGFVNASSYTVTIDGVKVGGKSLSSSDDLAADVGGLIEEYFSKKA